jgi:hypothetical protein
MGAHRRCWDSRCGCSCHRVNFASDIESADERLRVASMGCSHGPLLGPFTPLLGSATPWEQSIEANGSRAWLNALWAQRISRCGDRKRAVDMGAMRDRGQPKEGGVGARLKSITRSIKNLQSDSEMRL